MSSILAPIPRGYALEDAPLVERLDCSFFSACAPGQHRHGRGLDHWKLLIQIMSMRLSSLVTIISLQNACYTAQIDLLAYKSASVPVRRPIEHSKLEHGDLEGRCCHSCTMVNLPPSHGSEGGGSSRWLPPGHLHLYYSIAAASGPHPFLPLMNAMEICSSVYLSSDYHWFKKRSSYGVAAGLVSSALHNDSAMMALDLIFLVGQRINAIT